ncbi:hypothetical protein [Halomonas sp. HL-93]|uniref:hypothetical protein n=1 Tax=Halomonas sp. HL-93 TaxID=1666906 RepID=UPI0007F17BD7|nr:hypothetical protein [Halomonas sp. HL-93]SBR46785.1 hypothetical protein GA0071314_0895 [Halomonas sp. HL-93]
MPIDHTRRELMRVAGLAGIGALLPGATLIPASQAAANRVSPPLTTVKVDGWLLRASDR